MQSWSTEKLLENVSIIEKKRRWRLLGKKFFLGPLLNWDDKVIKEKE